MADVFLSYAREDQPDAERLAGAIEVSGRTVWWDRHIVGGSEFSSEIENQLKAARKIIVLWSAHSVRSRWVRDEASVAADSGRLVSVSLDGTPPPLGFRQFHYIDLASRPIGEGGLPPEVAAALGVVSAAPQDADPSLPRGRKGLPLLLLAMISLLLVAGTLSLWRSDGLRGFFEGPAEQKATLAILPFSVGGDDELAHLGKGLAIALSNGLSVLHGLTLISTTSTQAVVDRELPTNEIGDALGATHFVEGDIRIDGERVNATLRLIDARTERQLWSEAFAGERGNLPDLERRIGNQLAAAVKARLGLSGGDFRGHENIDPRAYDAYLRGMEHLSVRFDREKRAESLRQFRIAADIEPEFAAAHAGIAYVLSLSTSYHFPLSLDTIMAQQKAANDRALELDPDNVMAILARANAAHNYHGDIDASFKFTRRALELDPNSGLAHYSMGSSLLMAGRPQEALLHYDRAIAADPFNLVQKIFRILAYHELQDYQAIKAEASQCVRPCPGAAWEWFDALAGYGTPFDLKQDLDTIITLGGDEFDDKIRSEMRTVARYFVLGEKGHISGDDGSGRGFPYAILLAHFGHIDDAFKVIDRSIDDMQADEILLLTRPGRLVFPEHVRSDPRYHAIFEVPRFKAVIEYRRKAGITNGLPIHPVQAAR
ncbi:TIR domain-containing protein [Sphingomicrobium lutaoense]|uniref:TolB-like protein n=1 Tax=Sphingomicrobium lutaoense TaxID=515949 RepID=A0A839YSU9_9SPHN|nr:TIR domain-containing protein [Sphingomicrobium lutaoense]MBB3763361.1 TolB-like protein [Sphingomicrobium lutaoense]